MKIALVGTAGTIGAELMEEAARRGHDVTAVVPGRSITDHSNVKTVVVSIYDSPSLARIFLDQEAVLYAFALVSSGAETQELLLKAATRSTIRAAKSAGTRRLVAVAGASQPQDASEHSGPSLVRELALMQSMLSTERDLDWTLLCPSSGCCRGPARGGCRVGVEATPAASADNSIPIADVAYAAMNELERPQYSRQRIFVGV